LGTLTFTALAPFDTSTLNLPITVNQPATGYTGPTSLAIAPATSVQNEGDVGLTPFTFTVTRSGDTSVDITAQVDVTGSSANSANASDFGGTFPSQTVTFLAGETSKTVTINVSGDRVVEPDEQFTVTLGDPTNATTTNTTFTNTTAIGTILDDDTATISLGVSPISVVEDGVTNLVYTFTRTGGDTTTALTVNYNVGGTADLATDYVPTGATTFTASTGTVTFAPNATTATVTVNPNTDLIFEADETVALTLSTGTGYNIATVIPVTGTIANDDNAPVFAISSSSIIENGVVTFAVSRIGDAQADQSVTISTSIGGTDTASTNDFTAKTQTVTFAQGETTKNFTVQTTPDAVFEGNETFTATLSGATGGATISGANGIATGTINNDEAAPMFTIAAAAATEGNAIAFTITRSGDAQATQSVTVNTSIGGTDTANINDFTANTQILSFAQGETTKTFNVQSTQDSLFEGNETFTTTLSAATGGATISAANDTATGTINNNDAAPVFAIASASATEGNAIAFTVTRTGDAQATQSVTVNTSIGTTDTANINDFTANTQILSFAQGETSKTFSVQTTQDAIFEADETFTATLTTATNGAIIGTSTAKGTINDDDTPRISLANAPASVLENGLTNLVYTFTRTGLTTSALTVNYNVSGNTTFGNDYSQTGAATFNGSTGTVIFAANSATATVTIDPTADIIFESDETIALTLVNGSGYNIDTTTPVTGTITNDESVPIFAIASATATEGGTALFTITRTGDAQSTQSVTVTASIGATDNVISASDFTAKTETLSFAQGETTKTFSVQTTEDTLFESNETFTATLSTPTNGATISTTNGTATGTIDNDDPAPIFAIASTSITEGGLLKFTVTRTGDAQANQAVTVATSISGSNTTSTNDFTAKNETLTFAQGETTKTFSVQSAQDNLFEANEIFTTTLSAATNGATISSTNGLATGTINNDDPIPNATLSRDNNDVFKLDGVTTAKLKASLTDANSSFVNEVGVFNVDDASGKIGSFSMGSAGYAQAALERSEIIFSAIANKPTGYNSLNTRLLDVSESNLEFYLIKSGTTTEEALKSNNFSNVLFSQDSAQITNLGNNAFAIGWNDGSGNNDFKSLEMKVEGSDEPLVTGTQQQGNSFSGNGGGEVIDLRFTSGLAADTKSVNADFVVNREAAFNNFVGFYKVMDTNGGIDINGDGVADFTPGQSGYITAAVQNRVAGIDLAVSNQGSASFTGKTFDSNSIFAPFIIVNGNTSSFTDSNTSNDPAVYFSYLGANTDGVDHIRLLGSNTFGFEDLAGGGDRDFNDIIVKATLTAVK
jgi:3-phytase